MPRSGYEQSKNHVRRRLRDFLRLPDDWRLSIDDASGKANRSRERGRSKALGTDDDVDSCVGNAPWFYSFDSLRESSRETGSTLTHHIPMTPSPVCSSMSTRRLCSPPAHGAGSFIHFSVDAAAEQPHSETDAEDKISCDLSNGEAADCFFTIPVDVQVDQRSQNYTSSKKNSVSPPQVSREREKQGRMSKSRKFSSKAFNPHKFQKQNELTGCPNMRRSEHRSKQCSPRNQFQREDLAESAGQRLSLESESLGEVSLDIVQKDEMRRLSFEGDGEQKKRNQSNNSQHQSMSTQMPQSDGCNLSADFAISSEAISFRNLKSGRRSNAMESKLTEWFEAKTLKLIRSFRKKEAVIEEWEKERIRKAKLAMQKFEKKWEKKRLMEIDKMHMKITRTQQEAEKRKFKEHQAVTEELAKASKTFENIFRSGKRTPRFVCL